jgi:four helix bundle protein
VLLLSNYTYIQPAKPSRATFQPTDQFPAAIHHTQTRPCAKDQRLVVQINDSSESVMSNMAEGFGRGTQEEFITFLGYAIGSLDETQSH